MGSDRDKDPDAQDDETPQREVCLTRGYWLDRFEVTNAAYQRFIDDGGYTKREYWSTEGWRWREANNITAPKDYPAHSSAPDQPRVGVSWYEAEAYARWRGGRLPTEAEWEYAARGPQSRIYPWGAGYEGGRANIDEREVGGKYLERTASVGSYPAGASWVNAHDMAGNVWEWCADWYAGDYYASGPRDDPAGPAGGGYRVLRGGSWAYDQDYARAASRDGYLPDARYNDLGFRVVAFFPAS